MKTNLASFPLPLRIRRASGSVVLRWVVFDRFSPRKSTDGLPGSPSVFGGSPFGFEALQARSRLNQRPVDGEVLVGEQPARVGPADNLVEEPLRPPCLSRPRGSW